MLLLWAIQNVSQPGGMRRRNTPSSQSRRGLRQLGSALPADVPSLQMCSPAGGGCDSCLSLALLFWKEKTSRNGPRTAFRSIGHSNRLNLCGMWFHSADLDCAAQARHTPAWWESRIPFSAKRRWSEHKPDWEPKGQWTLPFKAPETLNPRVSFFHTLLYVPDWSPSDWNPISRGRRTSRHWDQDVCFCHTWSHSYGNSKSGSTESRRDKASKEAQRKIGCIDRQKEKEMESIWERNWLESIQLGEVWSARASGWLRRI